MSAPPGPWCHHHQDHHVTATRTMVSLPPGPWCQRHQDHGVNTTRTMVPQPPGPWCHRHASQQPACHCTAPEEPAALRGLCTEILLLISAAPRSSFAHMQAPWNLCHPTEGVDQDPSGTGDRWVMTHKCQEKRTAHGFPALSLHPPRARLWMLQL